MVQMIRYELLDIFVSKIKRKSPFSVAVICSRTDCSVELGKINMVAYFCRAELHLVLSFMARIRQSGQKSVCCVVSCEETLGVS